MSFLVDFTPLLIIIILIAFIFELLDASLGIGFGTVVTPVLLIIGYSVDKVVPSVLFSELCAGLVAILFHSIFRNVRLGKKKFYKKKKKDSYYLNSVYDVSPYEAISIFKKEETKDNEEEEEEVFCDETEIELDDDYELEEVEIERKSLLDTIRNMTTDSKIILILSFFGIIAAIIAAVMNVLIDSDWFNFGVKIYIGVMVLGMGIITLAYRNRKMKFSMSRIISLGVFAGFNKGISGGGYRPVTVLGQLLTGRTGRSALASTTFSKTAVSLVGLIAYILTHVISDLSQGLEVSWDYLDLAPWLIIGAALAAPIGAFITKKAQNESLKLAIAISTISLGIFMIIRISLLKAGIWEKIPSFIEIFETLTK